MSTTLQRERMERASAPPMRELADQAFSRAAGAPLVEGNTVRLLIDARENYPAWIRSSSTDYADKLNLCNRWINMLVVGSV